MVRDTDIDYDNDRIRSPFFPYPSPRLSSSLFLFPHSSLTVSFFTRYCKNTYGLTETEIEYVWDQYRDIIKEKIDNEK
jgi:hypothetical protein